MTYLLLFCLYFYWPGWICVKLLNIKHLQILTAFVFSYFLHVANLIPLKYFGASAYQYSVLINTEIVLLTVYLFWRERSQVRQWFLEIKEINLDLSTFVRSHSDAAFDTGLGIFLIAVVTGYFLLVGPYTEIPADAWHHLGEFQQHYTYLQQDQIRSITDLRLIFSKYAGYWYFLHAYIANMAGLTITESLQPLTLATSLSFLFCIYLFSLFLFGKGAISRREAAIVSVLTAAFYVLHFGVNIFSYIRYYAFAPTILNFIVYFSAVGVLVQFLRGDKNSRKLLALLPIHIFLLAAVHAQEALFLVVMSMSLILVYFIEIHRSGPGTNGIRGSRRRTSETFIFTDIEVARVRVNVLFITTVVLAVLVYVYSYINLDRHNPLEHGRMIAVENLLPFLKHMYILNPVRDFYGVVTTWGLFVYMLFLISIKQFRQYPYILAGMLLPLITVFNPFFTDLFLRYSWPEVLWRICYLIPLPFVAAFILTKSLGFITNKTNVLTKALSVSAVMLLLALLLPIHNTYINSEFSRIYTLAPVEQGNNYAMWADLIEYLETSPVQGILTDPVSGYVIKGMTNKRYSGYKFHKIDYIKLNYDQYNPSTFSSYAGDWLLVVNKRDGQTSDNGKRSGHWSKDVLQVSQYYSEELLQHVSNNPDLFKTVWEKDRITVYHIVEPT